MEVSPGLSEIVSESSIEHPFESVDSIVGGSVGKPSTQSSVVGISAFLEDDTIMAGMKHGFKLSTFR